MEKSGEKVDGFDLFIDTQVPLGGGLSSSASLGVAVITICEAGIDILWFSKNHYQSQYFDYFRFWVDRE